MSLTFRPATPADTDAAVPLVYSSGPAAFDFVFTAPGKASAQGYLRRAFSDGRGQFGCRNHVAGVLDGAVVATGAAWSGASNLRFAAAAVPQIVRTYGPMTGAGVMARGLRVESVIRPPERACWYVGNLGVRAELRGRGIGQALVEYLLEIGREWGFAVAGLDVAATNPRAQALYERLGFRVTHERRSRLANAHATVADHRRMELRLGSADRP